jgi:hypothetical protein
MQASNSDLATRVHGLLLEQIAVWPLLRHGIEAFALVETRTIELDDFTMRLQYNPRRLVSSAAKVDDRSIAQRQCFLCNAHLPPQQRGVMFDDYTVLCNPFPIFPEHFTIPHIDHPPQRIDESFEAMLDLAQAMQPRYTVFYNGPKCGASAPDHLHFQAGDRRFMTIEKEYDRIKGAPIVERSGVAVYAVPGLRSFIALESSDRSALSMPFATLARTIKDITATSDVEPMMNILTWFESGGWRIIVFPRAKHRPSFYFAQGDAKILLSPASVDLGGVCILPVERDFRSLTKDHLVQMFQEVMLSPDDFRQLTQRVIISL